MVSQLLKNHLPSISGFNPQNGRQILKSGMQAIVFEEGSDTYAYVTFDPQGDTDGVSFAETVRSLKRNIEDDSDAPKFVFFHPDPEVESEFGELFDSIVSSDNPKRRRFKQDEGVNQKEEEEDGSEDSFFDSDEEDSFEGDSESEFEQYQQTGEYLDEEDSDEFTFTGLGWAPVRNLFVPDPPKEYWGKYKPKGHGVPIQRSVNDGPVTIHTETLRRPVGFGHADFVVTRPTQVEGLVSPTKTTGRPSAPEPFSGVRVSQSSLANPLDNVRNSGMPDVEKGHIMALELGGPDVPENIVPQWAKWQGSGIWRRTEKAILELANKEKLKGNRVRFIAKLAYREDLDQRIASRRNLGFPVGFQVLVQIVAPNGSVIDTMQAFNEEQERDDTDDRLAQRQFDKIDT